MAWVASLGRRLAPSLRPAFRSHLLSSRWQVSAGKAVWSKKGMADVAAATHEQPPSPQQKELLADVNPTKHRHDDVGKVYRIDAEELKQIFPEGLCGELHNVLYGKRTKQPNHRNEKWWDLVLKDSPGILIRKESMKLISKLYCLSKNGVVKGNPRMDSAGFLLDGPSGSGKSTILNHVVHWARSTGDWLVVFVPQASRLVSGLGFFARADPEPAGEGKTILQPADAQDFLKILVAANKDKLEQLPFKNKLSGVEAPSVAEAVRQLSEMKLEPREASAMNVLLDTLDTLREQTQFPLLVAVDEFNALHGMSLYEDYKLNLIPAKDVVMAEALSRFTADAWTRGVVVGAATRTGKFGNVPLPRRNQRRMGHTVLGGYSRDEIKRYMQYMYSVGDLFTPVTDELVDYMHFTTQGRARVVEEHLGCEVFNPGLHNVPKKKRIGRWYHLNEGGPDTLFHPETGKAQPFFTHMELAAMRAEEEQRRLDDFVNN